jgi:hypothetical protein
MRGFALVLLLAGCDVLFPEFAGHPSAPDAATSADGGGAPAIIGLVCVLGDLRDYRSCGNGVAANMHVTVEETRDQAPVDLTGHFTLPLSAALKTATLAAVDPTGTFLPTVTTVALTDGRAQGVAVPIARADVLKNTALGDGVAVDEARAIVLSWFVDGNAAPLAGVTAATPSGADGPFYDGPQASDIQPARATGAHGLLALFNVPGQTVDLQTTAPRADRFTLPVRPGALTFSLLIMP